jgi:hypothetical protein
MSTRFLFGFLGLLFLLSTSLLAQTEYSYSYFPKTLYQNQLFPVTVMEKESHNQEVTFSFDNQEGIKPLFQKPLMIKNGKDTFYTFYFQASTHRLRIPTLTIESSEHRAILPSLTLVPKQLHAPKNYTGVLASKLNIKNYQVSNYDTKNHMVTLMIEALEANLEALKIPQTKESGLENLVRHNAKVTAEFYVVLPREQKSLTLCYFNTLKKKFVSLEVPIELSDSSVTTQSDLNPKVDAFTRLKKYALQATILFFFFMFLWKRDILYLLISVVALITLMTFYVPHEKICVKQGAPLYILPTSTSSIGTRIDNTMELTLLGRRGNYDKIEYKKGIIGWIKHENLCKN